MKPWLLAAAIAALLVACATTTSPTGRTQVVGGISQQQLDQLGAQAFAETKAKEPANRDAKQNASIVRAVLAGSASPAQTAISLLNAAGVIYVAGQAPDLGAGLAAARRAVESGAALGKLDALIEYSNR